MRVVLLGNKERGLVCLRALAATGHAVVGVVAHPHGRASGGLAEEASARDLPVLRPEDVNDDETRAALAALEPDVLVLAGYGQILRDEVLELAPRGAVNLHGGKLPRYRGSSPLNWALMNGDEAITLSAILLDAGVDTGDVVGERTLAVGPDETIAEVQARANELFPDLLVEVLGALEEERLERRPQDEAGAEYWPLRFPDDGLVVWDLVTAAQAHNRIRALAPPYPGAFTFWRGRRVDLLRSRLEERVVRGEPGRVYASDERGLLVCASDRCVRVLEAALEDGSDALGAVPRYDTFATVGRLAFPR